MRLIPFLSLLVVFSFCLSSLAQVSPTPEPIPIAADSEIVDSQAVEEPPGWLVTALDTIYQVPYVGPIVAKVVQWGAVLGMILTSLALFLIGALKALSTVLTFAKFSEWAFKIEALQKGKFLYWIKFFSFLNAKREQNAKLKSIS